VLLYLKKFWAESFIDTIYIINVLLTNVLHGYSPYKMLFSKHPDYTFFKVVGCACYPLLLSYNERTFDFVPHFVFSWAIVLETKATIAFLL